MFLVVLIISHPNLRLVKVTVVFAGLRLQRKRMDITATLLMIIGLIPVFQPRDLAVIAGNLIIILPTAVDLELAW